MKKRNVSIQLLRVSACLMVFLIHFGQRTYLDGFVRRLTDFGLYGVHLFLLISGFLAAKTFIGHPDADIVTYYKKRAIAILPLYYLVILYYFITENVLNRFVPVIPPDELGIGWFRYLFLLNGFLNSDTYFWSNLGITWTIPVFCMFYLIAPWILRKIKTVFGAVLVWLAVYAVTKGLGTVYSCVIFSNLHLMFVGVILYTCVSRGHSLPAISIFTVLAIFLGLVGQYDYVYVAMFADIILAMTAAETAPLPEWLQRMVNILDEYSYTVYLMHGVVFCSLIDRLNEIGVPVTLVAAVAVIGTAAATLIVGKYMEKPLQKWLKKQLLK